jgi:DNA-directed RNA polymerase specialized sigma24 family protein
VPVKERRETPVVFTDWSTVHELQRPFSPLQALMEARPSADPVDSVVGLLPLREAVADCLDALSAADRFMLEAAHIERITVRELAARMGFHKSYTYRLVKRAELRLRDECLQHPAILGYLGLAASIVPTAVVEVSDAGVA